MSSRRPHPQRRRAAARRRPSTRSPTASLTRRTRRPTRCLRPTRSTPDWSCADMSLDPAIAGLLKLIESAGYPPIHEGTPDDARTGIRMLMSLMALNPPQVASVEDATVASGIPVRVYRPETDGPVPTIVYLHGGGFVIGDLDTHDGVCRLLC